MSLHIQAVKSCCLCNCDIALEFVLQIPFGFPPMPPFHMGPSSGGVPVPNAGPPTGMPQGMHVFMDVPPGMGFRIPFGMQGV